VPPVAMPYEERLTTVPVALIQPTTAWRTLRDAFRPKRALLPWPRGRPTRQRVTRPLRSVSDLFARFPCIGASLSVDVASFKYRGTTLPVLYPGTRGN